MEQNQLVYKKGVGQMAIGTRKWTVEISKYVTLVSSLRRNTIGSW